MPGYVLHSGPAVEPLTVTEAKAHLRVDHTADDTQIESLIKSARDVAEKFLNRALITQTWKLYLDCFPISNAAIYLAHPPLQSVTSITYTDSNGDAQTLSASAYQVDITSVPARIVLAANQNVWPSTESGTINAVVITFVCGYGAAATAIPSNILHAIRLIVSDFYQHRENTVVGQTANEMPMSAKDLLWQDRNFQF